MHFRQDLQLESALLPQENLLLYKSSSMHISGHYSVKPDLTELQKVLTIYLFISLLFSAVLLYDGGRDYDERKESCE